MGFPISATARYPLLCYGIPALLIGLILYALPAQSADTKPQTNDTGLVMGVFPRRSADVDTEYDPHREIIRSVLGESY